VGSRAEVEVLIAGGSFAGLEALLALRALAEQRVAVELLAPDPEFVYRPAAVAEPFGLSIVHRFPLGSLAERCGARYRLDALTAVDASKGRVRTSEGKTLSYHALVIACGARAEEAIPGALTFQGPQDIARFGQLVEQVEAGRVERVTFAVPAGVSWPLPLYELTLLTARRARSTAPRTEITLVTPEKGPLALFGTSASNLARELLESQGVTLALERHPIRYADSRLELVGGQKMAADAVVSLPFLRGPYLTGLPHDAHGFLEVDDHGRVGGEQAVFAAGDVTAFPVKQGGLATQQADVVAETIAAEAGVPVQPTPLDPILRALLLTGDRPAYVRAALGGHHGDPGVVDWEPLWWPPAKVAGLYLAPFLAENVDLAAGTQL
jgi:sulfide:quinone oxidoreductase